MKITIQKFLAFSSTLLLTTIVVCPSTAAIINWTGASITAPSDVSTNGTLVGAMNVGQSVDRIINGITFAADNGSLSAITMGSATVTIDFLVGYNFNNDFWSLPAPGGDATYDTALDYARETDATSTGTVTFGNLVPGTYYEVQLWIPDTRDFCCTNRMRTVDGTLALHTGTGPHIARGVFKADSTTQVITIAGMADYGPQLNLLQLRSFVPNVVQNANDSGPGSLRQAVLDAAALPGTNVITFAPALSGATITLASEIVLGSDVTIDATSLSGSIILNGGNATRIFNVPGDQTVSLTGITLNGGNGAVFGGAISLSGNLSLTRCTLFGNHSFAGGAINNFGGTLSLLHCTLTGNSADGYAGAILNEGGLVTLRHCTLALNSTTSPVFGGGAIDNFSNGTLTMTSCILAGNAAVTGAGPELLMEDGTLNATNCLIGDGNDSSLVNGVNGNIVGTSGTPINALLAPLGNYGGPTQTMPPLPGSPAIDAASVIAGLTTDQRGSARNVGGAPDIGAVESGGLWVQNGSDSGANSLRDIAANTASVTNSKIILFVPALSGQTITLASEIVVSNNVAIDASSLPGGLTLSGGNATGLFTVNSGQTVFLRNLTFTGGNGMGGTFNDGGAIENDGNLTLTACTLSGNSVLSAGAGGGAILNYQDTLALTHCTLSGNSSSFGGAIFNDNATLMLTHCTLALNHSTGTSPGFDGGGAIDNYDGSILSMTACILAGNTAATGTGPELWEEAGTTVTANNCLIGDGTDSTLVNGVNGNLVGTSGSPVNALLAPLGNYGGLTQTMPPLPGSPAIDAAGASSFSTDQRGYPRPVGLAADIGAVEGIYNAAGPGKITSIAKLGNGSVQLSFTNLTDASFPVLATTNLSQSVSNWTVVGYASETSVGTKLIQFTDTQAPQRPQRYYRVRSP